jgi:hypothetical protein
MHLATLLPLLASFAVAVSAKAALSVRVQRAKDKAIDHWLEQSPQETCFDGDQRTILQKWQRRFEGAMFEEDPQIAA